MIFFRPPSGNIRNALSKIWIIAALVCTPILALAQQEEQSRQPEPLRDVFAVSNIEIDETAETVGEAKANGIEEGVSRALAKAFQRITLKTDWARLPVIPKDQVEPLVRDISLSDERFGGGRYLASLSVRFNSDRIRQTLNKVGIPYAETESRPIIALPVLDTGAEKLLWEPSNLWRRGWSKAALQQNLALVLPPVGDLSDVSVISASQALAGSRGSVTQFSARYQAGGVLVSVARPGVAQGGNFRVTVSSFALADGVSGETEVDTFTFPASTPLPEAYAQAALGVAEAHNERWKKANLISLDQTSGSITVAVSLSGLPEWLSIQRTLSEIRDIKSVRLTELSVQEAIVELDHIGDIARLRRSLAQNRIRINENLDTGQWVLKAVQ